MVAGPPALPGLDLHWSQHVNVTDRDGNTNSWHMLDTGEHTAVKGTIVAIHGNPTWSYMFRHVLADPPDGWRVIAVDQLNMGYSQRGKSRRIGQRVDDLDDVINTLNIDGPLVLLAHDWGGAVALGWAVKNPQKVSGIILANTGIEQPPGGKAPAVIRAARTRAALMAVSVHTNNFIRGGLFLSRPAIPKNIRAGYYAPYSSAKRRAGIADFVKDIPLEHDHPSAETLHRIAAKLPTLAHTPILLAWGAKDPVFSDWYLSDMSARLPHADVIRYPQSSHFVVEDSPTFASDVSMWINNLSSTETDATVSTLAGPTRLWDALEKRSTDTSSALVTVGTKHGTENTSWAKLAERVRNVASGLHTLGFTPGSRVALLVPPGADMASALYGVWRAGGVAVLVDPGLGVGGMRQALKSAGPDWIVGPSTALWAARAFGLRGRYISTGTTLSDRDRIVGAKLCLHDVETLARNLPAEPAVDMLAAVVFTSGATGPAKGVAYTHRELESQRDVLTHTYQLGPADRLLSAFAPFALFGPALGLPSGTPNMNMVKPSTLTASALVHAVNITGATVVFGSPAALKNVAATSGGVNATPNRVRLVLCAGAEVPVDTLRHIGTLFDADTATPYGMTEMLPVATINLAGLDDAGEGNGVCVGHPVDGADVCIDRWDQNGNYTGNYTTEADQSGEICVKAPWGKLRYDRAWKSEILSHTEHGYHRTGDVGHFDHDGRLWVEGRTVHTIVTTDGPVTPYRVETAVSTRVRAPVAAVGVGPAGEEKIVIVVQRHSPTPVGSTTFAQQVRSAVPDQDVSAVLCVNKLPVDIRHQSKIDRTRVRRWAEKILAGHSGAKL